MNAVIEVEVEESELSFKNSIGSRLNFAADVFPKIRRRALPGTWV